MVFHTSVTAVRINFQPVQKFSVELVHAWWLIDGTLISQSTKVSINDSHDVTRSCTKSLTIGKNGNREMIFYHIIVCTKFLTIEKLKQFWRILDRLLVVSFFVSIFINFILIYSFVKIFKSCNIILRAYYVELF